MAAWEQRRPPSTDEELARWTLGAAPQLEMLRAGLQDAVRETPGAADPDDLAERLTIVATELAGNALRHGRPPAVVTLHRAGDGLVIDVRDNDPERAPAVDDRRPPGDGGLGLVLAERLARDVGWYPTATGKGVWATFAVAPAAPRTRT